ncbi:DNA cytosine methyltransferase [Mycolicibacterium fortuitum]|uniref:DNA cytosine methyltransferase n=1 Tax=Mycolicibacterium fortuitum TaxID=1766 RepID=A0AAE4VFI3_MYCFO|nr:DNA cytosine methyltransferase [Mycolicibacterium fortuitum]MDV7194469.1 DNA cytosine methyltransferase [Mycolicibacterium fortuitum]MDV7207901.1 DNA cytosine methyltransferase [Mycolicibacterium fortuitum]MDV7229199.1 DNA cytosine methyltransferase [Mycolicibacterium fortuitum]MDV7260898.1 DNA cytosine methyltransferase [Mycolicibacterium fortuitum]MDV7285907.1 DNA cytosine methyltransferase [Mycolicibacterium fortuitum]
MSCVNHSIANTKKAYAQGLSLFDLEDPEFDERVTRSERDRATANCVLHYAAQHHPRLILVECTTELTSWGPQVPGKKYGDGSTFRWWIAQFQKLGYRYRIVYLNSMFFGVPQSRDRLYIAMWDRNLPTPDLDHRPVSWCSFCDSMVEAAWTWRTGVPPTGRVMYGVQYDYRCPRCRHQVIPPMTPSLAALDLTDLGTRIGDRDKPLADTTMARAERCRQRFAEFPAVLMPAKAQRGSERHPWQPLSTQTSQQETGILSTGAIMGVAGHTFERPGSDCRSRDLSQPLWAQTSTNTTGLLTPPMAMAIDNYQGASRGADEPLPTQVGSETLGLLSAGIVPYRRNTVPTSHGEAMPTVTTEQIPGLLTAAGMIKNNGSIDEALYRSYPMSEALGTVVGSAVTQGMLFSGWKADTAAASVSQVGDYSLVTPTSEWQAALADLRLEDCYYRMMGSHEIGRGCGFDVDFGTYKGSFIVWGSARNQTDGFGNAVSPAVGTFLGTRLRAIVHTEEAA